MLNKIASKLKSEFILVLFANILSYFIAFSGSVIYVRLLGKSDFGIYTFAFGIVSLFLLVNGFGAASGVLQYVSKSKSDCERKEYLNFAFRSGILFNLIIGILIIFYAFFVPLPMANSRMVLLGMALFPVGRLYIDIFQAYLRATGQNKLQATFLIVNNLVLLLINVVGVAMYKLYGLIYFTYIGYVVMYLFSVIKLKLPTIQFNSANLQIHKMEFISYSFFTTLSNAFSGLLFVIDTIIISYVIKDSALLATYKVATIIPFAINFIPNIIINYFYPQFAQNSHNPDKIKQLARYISIRMFIFSGLVSLSLIILAKPLVLTIFGDNYSDSILPFQIISFGYWVIATFRTVNGNILAALGKAKLSFYLTFIILIMNIIITYFMVFHFSINGAACAVVLMYIISSIIGYVTLKSVLYNMKDSSI